MFNIESEIAVYDKLAEPEILPQNIPPHTTPEAIIEIIIKLPNKKSSVNDLITKAVLKINS